jgi:ectoine hydroxylase-related dioxygenase (phytanoyl-CoA dioxygenase family)
VQTASGQLVTDEHRRQYVDEAYFGKEPGVPAIVPAGSLVVFSSLTFHRSGANTTNRMRRAYVTQYSPQPILRPEDKQPMHLAVPFLK